MIAVEYTLEEILLGVTWKPILSAFVGDSSQLLVSDVTIDSRKVGCNALFVAIVGTHLDAHQYVDDAVRGGCSIIVVQKGVNREKDYHDCLAFVVEVDDTSLVYSQIVANFYKNPADDLSLIGVTGTNGKTTVTYLLEDLLVQSGFQVGVIGTVNNRFYNSYGKLVIQATSLTTPDAKTLHSLFRQMVDAGVQYVIMEVSSHALSQSRIGSLSFHVVAFTNLTREHLDYHGDMDDYFSAKAQLFSKHLDIQGTAILPIDDNLAAHYREELLCQLNKKQSVLFWGDGEDAAVQLISHQSFLTHTEFVVKVEGCEYAVSTALVGRFNVDNLLVTIAVCRALGISCELLQEQIPSLKGAPGRVERVSDRNTDAALQPVVFVDYAHTPDALEKLLENLLQLPHDELIAVFGCGGDRDNGKRSLMGGIGARLADVVFVTSDNPRTEDPTLILEQVVSGVVDSGMVLRDESWLQTRTIGESGCVIIEDRGKAIEQAVRLAGVHDIVAIAGKGHEPYQLGAEGKRFFDDRLEVLRVLSAWTCEKIVEVTHGRLVEQIPCPRLLGEVVTDSRCIVKNSIFVALKGDAHDAHDYLDDAVEAGASCLVVEKESSIGCTQVVVADTTKALADLAHGRRRFVTAVTDGTHPLVVGLTGSSGKTTTKEMIASILSRVWPVGADYPENAVLKTQGNFNNLIGLPLSLLPLNCKHRAVVLEMGMNAPGEIKQLAEIADPDICCILNVHGAHLQGLGTIEGVAAAKGELFSTARPDAVFVVNLDDKYVKELADKYTQKKITFALSPSVGGVRANVFSSHISSGTVGEIIFNLHVENEVHPIRLKAVGEHNVGNSLAAVAVALACGATSSQIVEGLQRYTAPAKRMELLTADAGWTLLSDCYNANPASMTAALRALAACTGGKRIAVLGDMFELGDTAEKAHFELGELAASLGLDSVLVVGQFANIVRQGALSCGMNADRVLASTGKSEIERWLESCQQSGELTAEDIVLFKGSRGMRMETLVEKFMK